MKKAEFKKGTEGYVYKITSEHAYIDPVEVEEYTDQGYGYVWNYPSESREEVEIKKVYFTYNEAKKALMKTLIKIINEVINEEE